MAIREITMNELTAQPYCGPFLMYLAFEESSLVYEPMMKKCLKTASDFDFIQYLN